eukprot:TRINITY_DN4476_c0_g5_i1.p1 TRINITY_DN4476_c0_g5~~TRINITY_DN4476_c0_g5_i1.p1  ORF type:complete len:375 (-),score=84.76 TRINITY_DN4476_c0_g5_i1:111-1235(-)
MADTLEADLRWVDEETERAHIDLIRERLGAEMEGCPEDLTHDLTIARCLRGNSNDPELACEVFAKTIKYRKELIATQVVADFRASVLDAESIDMTKLPHHEVVRKVLPVRGIEGFSLDGLPVMVAAPRLIDFAAFADLADSEVIDTFFKCHLEQRALVLHNLSMKQKRMVKFIEVRDLNNMSVTTLLSSGRPLIAKFKEILQQVQDFYPEMLHRALMFNAPGTFATVFNLISVIMNERMKAKVRVFAVGDAFAEMTRHLSARAILSWMTELNGDVNLEGMELSAGCEEFTARRLSKGQELRWTASVLEKDIELRHVFLPDEVNPDKEAQVEKKMVSAEAPYEEKFIAESDGVVWLCVSNAHSWMTGKTVTLKVE